MRAKIQVTAIFLVQDMWRFIWRCHDGAHLDGHQHGGCKPAEISVTGFSYKIVNLEELKNVTINT